MQMPRPRLGLPILAQAKAPTSKTLEAKVALEAALERRVQSVLSEVLGTQDMVVIISAMGDTTDELIAGQVRVELLHDLNAPVLLGLERVSLPAGQAREFVLPIRRERNEAGDFGYEVRAAALVDGKATHTASRIYCMAQKWA